MSEPKVTTRANLTRLIVALNESFGKQIDSMSFKPRTREDLKAGFSDGVRAGVYETVKLLGYEVMDDPKEPKP